MAPHRYLRVFASILAGAAAIGPTSPALAQTVESPLAPRGALMVQITPSATSVNRVFSDAGTSFLGAPFDGIAVGSAQIPALVPVAERFASLSAEDSGSSLTLGTVRARFSGDERILPIQASYGILDRLTVGITVPLIRKRVETLLSLSPTGADVGRNPRATDSGMVTTFLSDAGTSLDEVGTAVEEACATVGDTDPECVNGRNLVADAEAFLGALGSAYDDETLFPLSSSGTGAGITSRWNGLRSGFSDWGVEGPEGLPLATAPIEQSVFESLAIDPAWPADGFPLETPSALLTLGDVELHAALGILQPEIGADGGPADGMQVALAVVGEARFGTGQSDSLRLVTPMEPPRGTGGVTLRTVADLLLPGRFALLGVIEAGWNGSTETTLLAPDPSSLFSPGHHATRVQWTPGSHLRARVSPRIRLGPGLSLGAGWETLRRQADDFQGIGVDGEAPTLLPVGEATTLHSASVELRFAAMDDAFEGRVPFPFEVMFRASRAVGGSDGAPVHTRAEALIRFRLRDFAN